MSSKKKAPIITSMKDPNFDPYEILELDFSDDGTTPPSEADIVKAYRKLALQLHPDKQQNVSPQKQDHVAQQFHALQEARAFLLEPEHANAKRDFDRKRTSRRIRKQQEAVRESRMSERRKRMRDELQRKEQSAAVHATKKTKTKKNDENDDDDDDLLTKLQKEGRNLREKHSAAASRRREEEEQATERQARKRHRQERRTIEERQVRVKWSRKRLQGASPSEHSLAELFSQKFGNVEHVEMLGNKGNAALVTFESAESCRPCVDAYATSDEMRTTFVGKKAREEYEEEVYQREQQTSSTTSRTASRSSHDDREGIEERKYRQAAERGRLIREMEMQDAAARDDDGMEERPSSKPKKTTRPFPLEFDIDMDSNSNSNLSPLQRLEQYETALFVDVLSPREMQQMQVKP